MTRKSMVFRLVPVLVFILFVSSFSQEESSSPEPSRQIGIGFTLSFSGLGIGGFYRLALPAYTHLGASLDFFIIRDEREISFVDPFTGLPITLNKDNNLFLVPLNLELKKRLFANDIEDNFRPHIMVEAGGIFGMNFPSKNRFSPDDPTRENEFRLSFDVALGFGVDIIGKEGYFVTVRPQYRFVYFPNPIADKKNHSAFEIRFEIGKSLQ